MAKNRFLGLVLTVRIDSDFVLMVSQPQQLPAQEDGI